MKYLWVDKDNNPWWEAVAHYGINGLFFDPRDPRVTKTYLEQVASSGKAVGIYLGHAWGEFGNTPESFAAKAKQWITPLRKSNSFPKVQWDLEQHDPEFILRTLQIYRRDFPWQDTSWTLESMQGGWMDTEAFVKPIIACRVRVCPQYFGGGFWSIPAEGGDGHLRLMEPFAPDVAFKDLLIRGFPANLISGCYDAKLLPLRWDGYAFTQGRLRSW
jgi:hypothetical protein